MPTYRTEVASELGRWKLAIIREPAEVVAVVLKGGEELAEHICELLNRDHTPDVDHTNGGREALAWVRHELDRLCPPAIIATIAVRRLLDRAAAELGLDEEAETRRMELTPAGQLFEAWGLIGMARRIAREGESDISNWPRFEECASDYFRRRDEDAPGSPRIQPEAAEQSSGVAEVPNGDSEAPGGSQGECDCGHEGLDAMFHLTPCPVATLRNTARRLGYQLTLKEDQ